MKSFWLNAATTTARVHVEPVALSRAFIEYFELFRDQPFPFLLDSAGGPESLTRYSVMGAAPSGALRIKRIRSGERLPERASGGACGRLPSVAEIEMEEFATARTERHVGCPFEALAAFADLPDAIREACGFASLPNLPFFGGAVGYIGFEIGHCLEALPDAAVDDLGLYDLAVNFYDVVVVCCHATGRTYVCTIGFAETSEFALAAARQKALALTERLERAALPTQQLLPQAEKRSQLCVSRVEYAEKVEQVRDHIAAGDVFEVCLTHRIAVPFQGDTWELYRLLRERNPAPFGAYLPLSQCVVLSSSPERFLRMSATGHIETRPIKGTRARRNGEKSMHFQSDCAPHATASQTLDDAEVDALARSEKDIAEHNMIVDLLRSDLGKVCKIGSVRVPELRCIETYATVHQMVSTIEGALDFEGGYTRADLLRAVFPGGSMTGAPKIEALKIIDALEPVTRGPYSGALGYLSIHGGFDLSIVIRTIIVSGGNAYVGVGGAVVYDSIGGAEYDESLLKARALLDVLGCPVSGPFVDV
jgi:para-aminobenzoate synthetase component I